MVELAPIWFSVVMNFQRNEMTICAEFDTEEECVQHTKQKCPGEKFFSINVGGNIKEIDDRISEFLTDNNIVGVELKETKNTIAKAILGAIEQLQQMQKEEEKKS